jgi:hypothetical protein
MSPKLPADPQAAAAMSRYQETAFALKAAAQEFASVAAPLIESGFDAGRIAAVAVTEGLQDWPPEQIERFRTWLDHELEAAVAANSAASDRRRGDISIDPLPQHGGNPRPSGLLRRDARRHSRKQRPPRERRKCT